MFFFSLIWWKMFFLTVYEYGIIDRNVDILDTEFLYWHGLKTKIITVNSAMISVFSIFSNCLLLADLYISFQLVIFTAFLYILGFYSTTFDDGSQLLNFNCVHQQNNCNNEKEWELGKVCYFCYISLLVLVLEEWWSYCSIVID